jgi:hypothetical protein
VVRALSFSPYRVALKVERGWPDGFFAVIMVRRLPL